MPRPGTLLLLMITASSAQAQGSPAPAKAFGTLSLSLGAAFDGRRRDNLERWHPSPGVEVRALLPFSAGSVELGVVQSTFAASAGDIPGFRARYRFIGWGAWARPVPRIGWRTGGPLGVYDLQFDDESLPDYA